MGTAREVYGELKAITPCSTATVEAREAIREAIIGQNWALPADRYPLGARLGLRDVLQQHGDDVVGVLSFADGREVQSHSMP